MSVSAGIRIPRDKISTDIYRIEGATVTNGQTFTKGWAMMRAAAGTLQVATEAPGLLSGGFAERDLVVADPNGNDIENAVTGIYSVDMSQLTGDYFLDTDKPAPIYAIDNQLFGKLPYNPSTGAVRSIAGCFLRLDRALYSANASQSSKCLAWIGPEGVAMAQGIAGSALVAPSYDAVITTIAAFSAANGVITASANGAIGAQDTNVTLTAGMRAFLPVVTGGAGAGSVTATLSGPYIVVNPGGASAKFVLARPPEWFDGMTMTGSMTFKVKPEGALWGGSEWRAFPATESKVVDTDDPHFWPRIQTYTYTIGSTTLNTLWMKSALGFSAVDITGAHAFWASTTTTGAGNGVLAFTGTASDVIVGEIVNW